ncbi:zinc finger protein 710-like [Daktulosphaira vitifoliae]|uniref:zinc finger protein 710-like n=1 Tax=Daktulosphaira vitifoliae TaxID=58002 RepID=UPI0021AA5263|nr:zinc finger protein 710-like [Daktulosphaira vitifoliae]
MKTPVAVMKSWSFVLTCAVEVTEEGIELKTLKDICEPNARWLESNKLKQLSKTDPALCPNQCGRSYRGKSRKAHLKRHLLHECGVPKKFKFSIGSEKWLPYLHTISKADPVFCPNSCGRCYKGEQRRAHLKRHLDNECGVPKKYQCVICLKRFSQKWSLKKHVLLVHKIINNLMEMTNQYWIARLDAISELNPAECPNKMCWRKYNGGRMQTTLYLSSVCTESDPVICPNMCGRRYKVVVARLNLLRPQAIPDPMPCPMNCGCVYKGKHRKYILKRHLLYECAMLKVKCPHCPKLFSQRAHYKFHLSSAHGVMSIPLENDITWKMLKLEESCKQDPAVCPNMCGRRYVGVARKSHLKRHLFYECGVPRQFNLICCESSWFTGKEYTCPNMCGKRYTRKHNLNRHLNYECGVEPRFTCDICLKKFTYKASMNTHRVTVHHISPECLL